MRTRWVLLLLLGLNLAYLGWGLHRAHIADPDRDSPPLEREPGVSEIQLIDSLADSPPPGAAGESGPQIPVVPR